MEDLSSEIKHELLTCANEARSFSYAPYSHYTVGAALLCSDGTIITGCNAENAAYSPGICAERCAIYKANSMGHRDFVAIAIAGSPESEEVSQYAYPCGVCRQVMREFVSPETFIVLVYGPNGKYDERLLVDLLPESFGPDNLK